MHNFLLPNKYINSDSPHVIKRALIIADENTNKFEVAKACFEYVRDEIKHSVDYEMNPITVIASDVLKYKTGFCYAKSHLLAALLRANRIAAGLCYQRLTIVDEKPAFCLHGLNAIYLEDYGWFRVDARGNKEGVNAQFDPTNEQLAFDIKIKGEYNLPEIWSEPLPIVTKHLEKHKSFHRLAQDLPDVFCI